MGGLVGRAMGGMLGGVARQLQQQQQQVCSSSIPKCLTDMHWCFSSCAKLHHLCLGFKRDIAGAQAADLRQQALHAVQGDRRVQAQLGRDISVGPGG